MAKLYKVSVRAAIVDRERKRKSLVSGGVSALAERLCGIEAQWLSGVEEPEAGSPVAVDDMSQLDLLLKSIQNDAA